MVCVWCSSKKNHDHDRCPSKLAVEAKKPPTGLSPESDALQLSGLCTCQHREPRVASALVPE